MDVAFGVIGVVALTIELIDSINKLEEFIESFRDAPAEFQLLCSDLRIMSCILKDIQAVDDARRFNTVVLQAVQECSRHIKALKGIASSLVSGFESASRLRRNWSSLKATKKAKKLEHFRSRLDSAKNTLIIAQQVWMRHDYLLQYWSHAHAIARLEGSLEELSRRQRGQVDFADHKLIAGTHVGDMGVAMERHIPTMAANPGSLRTNLGLEQNIRNLVGVIPTKETNIMIARWSSKEPNATEFVTGRSYPSTQCRSIWSETITLPVGKIRCHTTFAQPLTTFNLNNEVALYDGGDGGGDEDGGSDWNSSMWFVPSSWLLKIGLSRVVYIALSKSAQHGWKSSFRSFNLVPSDSLIFESCKAGNLDAIKRSLTGGHASINDVDSLGWTPLHFAASKGQHEVVKFLLGVGASMLVRSSDGILLLPILTLVSAEALGSQEGKASCLELCKTLEEFRSAGFDLGDSMEGSFDYTCWFFLPHVLNSKGSIAEKALFFTRALEWFLSYSRSSMPYAEMFSSVARNMVVQAFCASLCSLDTLERMYQGTKWEDCSHASIWFSSILTKRFPTADKLAEVLSLTLAKIGTLHFESPIGSRKTFLLRIMARPSAVAAFIASLHIMHISLEQFAAGEAGFHKSQGWETGWTEEALLELLSFTPERNEEADADVDNAICEGCRQYTRGTPHQPPSPWHRRLEMIKRGRAVDTPASKEEEESRRRWSIWKEQRMCLSCQESLLETASDETEDEGDDEWSPFQINWG